MRIPFLFIAILLAPLALTRPAAALPAPMSPERLAEASDVVALVRVLSVTCTSLWQDGHSGETLRGYSAELELVDVTKGGRPGEVVTVGFEDIPAGMLGPWSVFYYPGEEVWTHLRRGDDGTYETTWWNARGEERRQPDTKALPTEVGETVRAGE